ncbi:MAG TPA: methyltransferase domain-containing protein [Rhizomicrobium sp.]|jgi:SAM-dependent methyltransferase|nr:methyltransferase domain-containing protein [Rhizomicrobium sp.]
MHKGKAYHDFMRGSARDLKARERFQDLVGKFTPYRGTILDFGAGTGIDAKAYAGRKFKVLVYEPCEENLAYLVEHCRGELEKGDIIVTDLSASETAHVIAADFAVLNLVADHRTLFATFYRLLAPKGYVVVNLLNPFFLGDARYAWWRANFGALLRSGGYAVEGDDGAIYRMTPAAISLSAQAGFRRTALYPGRLGLAGSQYMFMVFRKKD